MHIGKLPCLCSRAFGVSFLHTIAQHNSTSSLEFYLYLTLYISVEGALFIVGLIPHINCSFILYILK